MSSLSFVALLFAGALLMPNAMASSPLELYVLYDNVPFEEGLETGWGFACLIRSLDTTVLFDTGADGDVLLANMEQLGLRPEEVDAVVLSHIHRDHTGGLHEFLDRNHEVTVYLPQSFPSAFARAVEAGGAAAESVGGPRRLIDDVHSTGEMGTAVKEQALIVDTSAGMVIVTGCAHPNVADMAEQARTFHGKDIHLLMGGFHLRDKSDAEIGSIVARLRALGVRKVAPSHCTGKRAVRIFREAWGENFIEGGLGAVIEVRG